MIGNGLDGWAINRIPLNQPLYGWSLGRGGMNLVNVHDLVLQEDHVEYSRSEETGDCRWPLKL
ncbi:MAG: hypothetical protein JXA45_04480 [Methanomassiliicoccales archaeon]|nr:hypothetical protein [Methanomassiliicoccales archaeon]